jgi:hypothetical protein
MNSALPAGMGAEWIPIRHGFSGYGMGMGGMYNPYRIPVGGRAAWASMQR